MHGAAKEEQQQQQPPPRCLKVGIDANLLGFKYVNTQKSLETDGAIWNIAKAFSALLIDLIIICDHPTKQHSSKRASCYHRGIAEKDTIELIVARSQLQSLLSDSTSKRMTDINAMQKWIRSLENASKR